jgi:predicted CXXCH cytochrome family protein
MENVTTPARESAKQRSRRIPLDYYRQPTLLDRVKWRVTAIAAVVGGLYVLWVVGGGLIGSETAARQWSPAPVADVHAAWDGQCSACHVTGASQRSDSGAVSLLAAPFLGGQSRREAADGRCIACHAGPAHHDNQFAAEVVSCAACHRDHQGRSADLTRVADAMCTACHADPGTHVDGKKRSVAVGGSLAPVASWLSHPEFRSIGGSNQAAFADPGKLRFNHALHMQEGQVAPGATDDAKWKWERIRPEYRPQLLAGRSDQFKGDMAVQLTCASCHQLDDAASGEGVPALGAYMQPIRYERHCAGCHQEALRVDSDRPTAADAKVSSLGILPHGLAPAEVRAAIAGLLQPLQPAAPLSPARPLQPIPGKTPGENLAQRIADGPGSQLATAETQLLEKHRCGKCHVFAERGQDGLMPAIQPTAVPTVWLKHARFAHSSHRAMQCFDCHAAKHFAWSKETKFTQLGQPPMIPNREMCAKCHGPTTDRGVTGARFDCVECHRYHGGDLGPHGIGAAQRGVPPDRSRDLLHRMTGESSSDISSSSSPKP